MPGDEKVDDDGKGQGAQPLDLDDRNFGRFIAGAKYAAVLFWSGSCMPCRMLLMIFGELASLRQDVSFGKVNVGTSTLANRLGVMSVPTILLFREGRKVARIVGVKPLKVLIEVLDNYFSENPKEDVYSEHGQSSIM